MLALVKEIRETKTGNDLFRVCIAEDIIVETDTELQVTVLDAQVVEKELATKMQKALDGGKKVTLNFKMVS
tara:strand:+ start:317 stop:529 length:213 start_codon:yes stop_codon:yes gene_type:complete